MSTGTLRLALAAWVRYPREMGLANVTWVLATLLPLPLLRLAPEGGARYTALALLGAWVWVSSAWLCVQVGAVCDGVAAPFKHSLAWLRTHWLERLLAYSAGLLALAWWGLVLRFYLGSALPPLVVWPLLGLLGGTGLWGLLALLLSQGVAAEAGRGWRDVWKASALLPLGYLPSAILALALLAVFSGLPVLLVGLKHWSAPLLLTPLLLAPFFTAAFYAVYLVLLSRALFDRALGRSGPQAPDWRELWNPWR
jgi:hypothetical protein